MTSSRFNFIFWCTIRTCVNNLLKEITFNNAIGVMFWCSIHILSVKFSSYFSWWTLSENNNIWWWPNDVQKVILLPLLSMFYILLYSSSGIIYLWMLLIISLLLFLSCDNYSYYRKGWDDYVILRMIYNN